MLPVHERFYTFQGEGVHMGRAAFFIRTFGCPLHCPWCDSAGTWHKDYVPDHIERMAVAELVGEVIKAGAPIAIVTGGEPTIHNLHGLTSGLRMTGVKVHLETSGTFPVQGVFDWITLSPKWNKLPLEENVQQASEFKLIIEKPSDIDDWVGFLTTFGYRGQPVWLHPEWSHREDPAVLTAITEYVKQNGDPFRAGYQIHKLYRCDALDNRAAKLAPLGGNPALGY